MDSLEEKASHPEGGVEVVCATSPFHVVSHGRGLLFLKVACVVITMLPFLCYGYKVVRDHYPLYFLLAFPLSIISVLVSVVLFSSFESASMSSVLKTKQLRLRIMLTTVVFSVLYLSEKHVDELFAVLSMVQFGATAEQVSLIGAFTKPFWFLGIGLLVWVLAHAFNGAETLHQFKRGLAMRSLEVKVNADGDRDLEVKFKSSDCRNRAKANCSFPAYYTGVVMCWIAFALVVQCLSIIEGFMFLSVVFGGLNCIFMSLIKDLKVLSSQKAIYEYIANMQNKLSVKQVGKNAGVEHD